MGIEDNKKDPPMWFTMQGCPELAAPTKINVKVAVLRTHHCAHVAPLTPPVVLPIEERTPDTCPLLRSMGFGVLPWERKPEFTQDCPKCRQSDMTIAEAVTKLESKANGSRPLLMVSHMAKRNRRHRFAEPTDQDRVHNMTHDDEMREWHRDGEACFMSKLYGQISAFERHMAYTWEESDRMFHEMWHGEGE